MTDCALQDNVALVDVGDAVEVVWEDHESVTLVLRTANGLSVELAEIVGLEALKPQMDF